VAVRVENGDRAVAVVLVVIEQVLEHLAVELPQKQKLH
jgi:hypothetical protein